MKHTVFLKNQSVKELGDARHTNEMKKARRNTHGGKRQSKVMV